MEYVGGPIASSNANSELALEQGEGQSVYDTIRHQVLTAFSQARRVLAHNEITTSFSRSFRNFNIRVNRFMAPIEETVFVDPIELEEEIEWVDDPTLTSDTDELSSDDVHPGIWLNYDEDDLLECLTFDEPAFCETIKIKFYKACDDVSSHFLHYTHATTAWIHNQGVPFVHC